MWERKNPRLKDFNYSGNSIYYITTTIDSELFGKVDYSDIYDELDYPVKRVVLSHIGEIVREKWLWLQEKYPYVILHDFIIMPDHFHGIIEINSNIVRLRKNGFLNKEVSDSSDIETFTSDEIKIKSLSQLIGAFKTVSSKEIHLAGFKGFKWNRSFHDRIIRNYTDYCRIKNYITTNPDRWII